MFSRSLQRRADRRLQWRAVAVCGAVLGLLTADAIAAPVAPPKPLAPVPSPQQVVWQRMELAVFLHFGVNTFTNREWGDGSEDPKIFQPHKLDCRQWARAARQAGFKLMILTAKHHDGFCLWPTKQTDHCVRSSTKWRGGKGDVVREFVDACKAEGLAHGLYLSPWDRHEPSYGKAGYNAFFQRQITELLTRYGPVTELWHDGAHGRGVKGDFYQWQDFYALTYKLSPKTLIAIMGPDVRWVGNESGVARVGESSVRNAGRPQHAGKTGKLWWPPECDVSIRPGWFWHKSQDARVKTLEHLMDIYFKSVGRNSVLLLNIPPNSAGLLADPDVKRLAEFKAAVDEIHSTNLAAGAEAKATNVRGASDTYAATKALDGKLDTYWATDDKATAATLELTLPQTRTFNVVNVREAIALGERVRKYHIEARQAGTWKTVGGGTIIGQRNLLRLHPVTADAVRLVIDEAAACPAICEFSLHHSRFASPASSGSLLASKPCKASDVHPNGTMYGGDKAIDDDMATRWATSDATRECWLEVDMGEAQKIGRVTIAELTPRITEFQIEYKAPGDAEWKVALAGTKAGKKYAKTFPPVTARHVRLHVLDATFAPTIWEFRVFPPKK